MKKWNYYNDNNPYVAQWARNLIKAGLAPNGVVDERSIKEVKADDLKEFVQCHFFCGILGWSYALRLANWHDDEPVWTGSCPCQPLSVAGQRKGHADERHLWPAFHRLIEECKPSICFGEQVAGKDGLEWMSGVRSDLEAGGYACGVANLPAASVGSPHQRQRLFWGIHLHGDKPIGEERSERKDQATAEWSVAKTFKSRDRRFSELVAMDIAQPAPTYAEAIRMVDGIPCRMEQLRAYGNAIVPAVAKVFIEAFLECRP